MALWNISQHRTIWGWKFQNASPTVFIWCQTNLMRTLATMVEYRLSPFLVSGQVLRNLWHFLILTWESMGKPKMWNISKTDNCWAKRTKIWESGSYRAHREGTFDAQFLEFGLGSFGALWKISNFIAVTFFRKMSVFFKCWLNYWNWNFIL